VVGVAFYDGGGGGVDEGMDGGGESCAREERLGAAEVDV
jgi:hypothetical protein